MQGIRGVAGGDIEDDAQNVRLPAMKAPATFVHQAWDRGPELALLRSALGLLGGAEQALMRGMNFRRIQGASAGGAGGFCHPPDNSVNLLDAARPVSMGEWYQIGGAFQSGGVRTALHEIGHALAYAQPAGAVASTQQAFQNAVLGNWQGRNPPARAFPPPAQIPLPTSYARTGWGEFFAETYSIFRTTPGFLQNAEYQYLFDFFAARF
jgi:hypothetical protein